MTPLMVEEWLQIEEFPGYSVSNLGRVRNDLSGRILTPLTSQRVVYVGLSKGLIQHSRSVTRLVAEAFLPLPELPHHQKTFDTPIHLNGDKSNNQVWNLMWRPRWFAAKYHGQFTTQWRPARIQDVDTGDMFKGPLEAATAFGILAVDVLTSALNFTLNGKKITVWPTEQQFELIGRAHIIPRQNRRI